VTVAAAIPDLAFRFEVRVDEAQLGTAIEHVSNVQYVRWVDLAAERCLDAAGFTRARLKERGLMFFVGRHEIDYLAETFLGDELLVATWLSACGRAGHERRTSILRRGPAGADEPVCTARSRWVLVDLASRRPVRVPDDLRAALGPVLDGTEPDDA